MHRSKRMRSGHHARVAAGAWSSSRPSSASARRVHHRLLRHYLGYRRRDPARPGSNPSRSAHACGGDVTCADRHQRGPAHRAKPRCPRSRTQHAHLNPDSLLTGPRPHPPWRGPPKSARNRKPHSASLATRGFGLPRVSYACRHPKLFRKADGRLLARNGGSSHWLAISYHLRCAYDALPQSMVVHGVDDARVHYFAALAILAIHPLGSHWSPARNGVVASPRRSLPMAFSLL
jgi:hypothetical protein